MNKKTTIQDIADALGISRNTVSKAINNSDGLADATREKILQKALEMGYKNFSYFSTTPKAGALFSDVISQAPTYQGEIALLTGTFLTGSHFASLMLDKFQNEMAQLGYTLNTHRVTEDNFRNKALPLTVNLEQVKAILCVEMFDWEYDEMLCRLNIPILFVDGPSKRNGKSLPADQLYMDNTTEIATFITDTLAKGYTKIGWIGDYDHCQSFFERYCAFYLTMVMNGQTINPGHVVKYRDDYDLIDHLGMLKDYPEVFVCANDFVAIDTIKYLKTKGIRVPEDIQIFGFDDSAESRLSSPPMSTVHIHTQVIAVMAVQLLMSRINNPELDYRTVHTETDLIYRSSTR